MCSLHSCQRFGALVAHCNDITLLLAQKIPNDVRAPISVPNDTDSDHVASKTCLQRKTGSGCGIDVKSCSHSPHPDLVDSLLCAISDSRSIFGVIKREMRRESRQLH